MGFVDWHLSFHFSYRTCLLFPDRGLFWLSVAAPPNVMLSHDNSILFLRNLVEAQLDGFSAGFA